MGDGSNMEISNPIYMKDYDDEDADGFSFDGDKVRMTQVLITFYLYIYCTHYGTGIGSFILVKKTLIKVSFSFLLSLRRIKRKFNPYQG